ncbi:hypothetical protein JOE68_005555 [Saccharothrix algeriensis]|uniref:Uncharacterized protein n=1 Tax=Saccharothrix algeriensis TaxID=173560 RepID=A0ABS2SFW8_9PSEU|nr:hypothetical protein [Saccharothrix algeriensis]
MRVPFSAVGVRRTCSTSALQPRGRRPSGGNALREYRRDLGRDAFPLSGKPAGGTIRITTAGIPRQHGTGARGRWRSGEIRRRCDRPVPETGRNAHRENTGHPMPSASLVVDASVEKEINRKAGRGRPTRGATRRITLVALLCACYWSSTRRASPSRPTGKCERKQLHTAAKRIAESRSSSTCQRRRPRRRARSAPDDSRWHRPTGPPRDQRHRVRGQPVEERFSSRPVERGHRRPSEQHSSGPRGAQQRIAVERGPRVGDRRRHLPSHRARRGPPRPTGRVSPSQPLPLHDESRAAAAPDTEPFTGSRRRRAATAPARTGWQGSLPIGYSLAYREYRRANHRAARHIRPPPTLGRCPLGRDEAGCQPRCGVPSALACLPVEAEVFQWKQTASEWICTRCVCGQTTPGHVLRTVGHDLPPQPRRLGPVRSRNAT